MQRSAGGAGNYKIVCKETWFFGDIKFLLYRRQGMGWKYLDAWETELGAQRGMLWDIERRAPVENAVTYYDRAGNKI